MKEDDTMSYKHDGAQRWVHSEGLNSDRTAADYYRYDTLFPARVFGTNYGRTIRMLLDPQRARLQRYQDFSLVQKPIVVLMMTRGRILYVDQSDTVNNGSMQQQVGPSSQKESRSDFRKKSSKNRPSRPQKALLDSSAVTCPRKPWKKRKIEDQGSRRQDHETSTSVRISQRLVRDKTHSLSSMDDKDEEDGNIPIKAGRWSTAEDAALFQGVQNHLVSLGLEPQRPLHLPSETERGEHLASASGTDGTACLRGQPRELLPGAITEDSTFFDSVVDASYYVDGVDSSLSPKNSLGPSFENHPLVSLSIPPPSGSSGTSRHGVVAIGNSSTLTATEASNDRNGSQSGQEHFHEQHSLMKIGADTFGQIILSDALFEELSVVADYCGTVNRGQGGIQQDDSGDSLGSGEIVSEQHKRGAQLHPSFVQGDRQVSSASLAGWLHSGELPPSQQILRRPADVSSHAWTQQDARQILSHPCHKAQPPLTHAQSPTDTLFSCEAPLNQPTAVVAALQQQRGNYPHSGQGSVINGFWHTQSTLRFDSVVSACSPRCTYFPERGVGNDSTGNDYINAHNEPNALSYLEHPEDYNYCTKAPSKLASRSKTAQHHFPEQNHPLHYPSYLNFTRSPSTRHSHSQSPLSFSLPPSSRNSPRLSSDNHVSPFTILDHGTCLFTNSRSMGACESTSNCPFDQVDHSLHNKTDFRDASITSSLGPGEESHSFDPRPLPQTRESYALAISRAMSTCPWNKITRQSIPGRTGVQAQARWSEALDPQVKKGKWSPEEDALLLKGVQESHKCWIWIADGIPGRTQRQCRTRWVQISTRAEREATAAAVALAKSQARGLGWDHAPLL
ncbi:hypothetical protein BGZ68_000188 [Mortierella alpina]|nr:hypothetical protein BGZ68_000188 [Mortierella alpina]